MQTLNNFQKQKWVFLVLHIFLNLILHNLFELFLVYNISAVIFFIDQMISSYRVFHYFFECIGRYSYDFDTHLCFEFAKDSRNA